MGLLFRLPFLSGHFSPYGSQISRYSSSPLQCSFFPAPNKCKCRFGPTFHFSLCNVLFFACILVLRACPREHRAVVLHAISPISMKLCQFKGSTSKLKKTNRFLFWFFPGGDRPPPGFSWFSPRKSLQIGKLYEALTAMVFN